MHPLYIDLSDEITTVIERLKAAPESRVALIVPKGASLIQSIVNLKLAKRAAVESGKELVLVTTDKIGKNLAGQVGIAAVSTLEEGAIGVESSIETDDSVKIIDGVKVHRYYEEESATETTPSEIESLIEPIIPRQIMQEAPAPEPAITVRKINQIIPPKPETPTPTVPVATVPEVVASANPTPVPKNPLSKKSVEIVSPSITPESKPPIFTALNRRKIVRASAYILILILLGAGGTLAFYFPKTTVTVKVVAQSWEKELTTIAKAGGTPALEELVITSTETLTIKATGTKETGELAKGTAKLFNTDSSDPKDLAAGTKISANGLVFITQEIAKIPGARIESGKVVSGETTVPVTAETAGTSSNLTNTTATISNEKLFAQIVSTTGGTSKQVPVITATDIATAKTAIQAKVKESTDAKLVASLQNRDTLFDAKTDTFIFDGFTASLAAGVEAESFTATAKGVLTRLVVDKSAILSSVAKTLRGQQEPDTTYQVDQTAIGTWTVSAKDKTISVTTTSTGRKAASVDTSALKAQLTSKTQSAGEKIVKTAVREGTTTITRSPSWWPIHNFPYSGKFLTVRVVYE